MEQFGRITMDPEVMGGKPCIRGMRVTVGMIVGAMAAGRTIDRCWPTSLMSKRRILSRLSHSLHVWLRGARSGSRVDG